MTNDVKYLPLSGGLSDMGQRETCLREPRGAGEFRLTGHSGFSAFGSEQRLGLDRYDQLGPVVTHRSHRDVDAVVGQGVLERGTQ